MKKTFVAIIVQLVFVMSMFAPSIAQAGLFDIMATSGWSETDSDVKYKMETYGYDVRVYEWTPAYNENVRCVFVAGNKNSTGVACYEVSERHKGKK